MSNPLISIVIPNINGDQYLKQVIPVILDFDYSNYEIIIVDNGSTDSSIFFLESINNSKLKLIKSTKNKEKNFAVNLGVKESNGEYLFLCDNDVIYTNKSLLTDLLTESYKLIDFGCLGVAYKENGFENLFSYGGFFGSRFIARIYPITEQKVEKMHLREIGFASGQGIFMKKSLWNSIGGYDDYLKFGGDDNDLGIKIWMSGHKCYLYSKTIQIHIGKSGRTGKIDNSHRGELMKISDIFYAQLYTIIKNYRYLNLVKYISLYTFWHFVETLVLAKKKQKLNLILSLFIGYFYLLMSFPHLLKQRKKIQKERIVKDDIFLEIKP